MAELNNTNKKDRCLNNLVNILKRQRLRRETEQKPVIIRTIVIIKHHPTP